MTDANGSTRGEGALYDTFAGDYAKNAPSFDREPAPALQSLIGPPRSQRVLDLACGHGPYARWLAERGAEVVGVDLSGELLKRARELESAAPLGITYLEGDAEAPDLLPGEVFDGVVCNFGLTDIADLEAVLANVARLLGRGGWFVFSILHPCFAGTDKVSGSWPLGSSYNDERWWRAGAEFSILRQRVGSHHRMISTYVNALLSAGLVVDQMKEPPPADDWAAARPGAGAQPVYLVVRARR